MIKITYLRALLLATTLLTMLIVPLWFGGEDSWLLLRKISPLGISVLIALTFLKWGCLTIRWKLLLATKGYHLKNARILPIILASDFAGENIPANIGNMSCNLFFFKQAGVPMTVIIALSNFIYMLDLLAVAFAISLALVFSVHTNSTLFWLAISGIFLALLVLSMLLIGLKYIDSLIRFIVRIPLPQWFPKRLKIKIFYGLFRLKKHYKNTLKVSLKQFLPIFFLSFAHWLIRFSWLYVVILIFGFHQNWGVTALMQFVSGLAGMITFLPGGFPGTDISIATLLHTSLPIAAILSILLLWRLSTYHVNFLAGVLSFLWLGYFFTKPQSNLQTSKKTEKE